MKLNVRAKAVVRFLAKLWVDQLADLVEVANRSQHGGTLKPPYTALAPRHYRSACAQLLAEHDHEVGAAEPRARPKRERDTSEVSTWRETERF